MSIYRDKRTGRWRYEFDKYVGSVRRRQRKLLPAGWSRAQADAFDRAQSAALYAVAAGLTKPRHLIDEAVTRFAHERAPGLKHGANQVRELVATQDWWAGRTIEELPKVCDEYAVDQLGALAPATIRNRIAYLRSACRWAWKKHGLAESDPGARVTAPAVRNARDTIIDRPQMIALARACKHRGVRALIRILFYSGMRVSEAQRARRAPGVFILDDTKNNRPRIVPMMPVIRSAAAVPMPKRSQIDYYWPLARAACGLGHVRLHDIRHSVASMMVNNGEDLGTVGAVLGHKSAQTTKRYAHYGIGRLASALGATRKR